MDNRAEVRDFLRSRRARISPSETGIRTGGHRRVPGLRREEVAMLAGVSIDYYAKMERGNLTGVSADVLDALARTLRLDEAETDHLHDLARSATPAAGRRQRHTRAAEQTIRPSLQRFLDTVTGTPAWVRNQRMDFIAANQLGRTLLAPMLNDAASGRNNARFVFLSPAAQNFDPDWDTGADDIVATLRTYAGQNPRDKGLTDLIGELVTRSDTFRHLWAAHNVRYHRTGLKRIHHPDVGDLEFAYEAMELPDSPGWTMFAYTAPEDSPTQERLRLLGSLAASTESTDRNTHRDTPQPAE